MIIDVVPYLEVLCVSEETRKTVVTEEESRAATCPQDHENQGSLITLAWGKPSEDSDQGAEDAGITQDSSEMRSQPSDVSGSGELGQFDDRDDVEPTLVQCESTAGLPVDAQRSTFAQVTSEKKPKDTKILPSIWTFSFPHTSIERRYIWVWSASVCGHHAVCANKSSGGSFWD